MATASFTILDLPQPSAINKLHIKPPKTSFSRYYVAKRSIGAYFSSTEGENTFGWKQEKHPLPSLPPAPAKQTNTRYSHPRIPPASPQSLREAHTRAQICKSKDTRRQAQGLHAQALPTSSAGTKRSRASLFARQAHIITQCL